MSKIKPPIAKKKQYISSHFGIEKIDNYHWLRADNWQEVMRSPQKLPTNIKEYLEAENNYFEKEFAKPNKKLSEKIYQEIRARIKEDNESVPFIDGEYAYFTRTLKNQQYAQIVRTKKDKNNEEILLDCNIEAGQNYFGFGGATHSPNHKLLLWACDKNGSEYYTIYIRDIASQKDYEEKIINCAGVGVWANDSKSFYYVELNKNHRPFRVKQHFLGNSSKKDKIIYEERDSGFFITLGKTLSRNFIIINAHDHTTSENWLIDANRNGEPKLVGKRKSGHEYYVDERDGLLYIRTNIDGAKNFKIMTTPTNKPQIKYWQDYIVPPKNALIVSTILFKDYFVRLERFEGLPRIIVRNLNSNKESAIKFDEQAYSLGIMAGYEFDSDKLRFNYSSPTTPNQTYDYNLKTKERTLLKEQEIPSGHRKEDYITKRIFAKAKDGEKIPITLLYKRGFRQNGKAPALLYAYGSYGISIPASFSISHLSLVDRGFVYAIAHIRGGMEKGYEWYENGRHLRKKNTFNDYICAAQKLIAGKFTSPQKLVAQGGSVGGMLMGVIANQRPDLFGAIIAQVPFVDVLNTMLDDSLPLTPPEWPEWGNPLKSKKDYDYIASYSPYDNIKKQEYPAIFALAGLSDPRVTYWEPAKWVAKLREYNLSKKPIYLKTNMRAGHGGASGRFEKIKETALTYAFAIKMTG